MVFVFEIIIQEPSSFFKDSTTAPFQDTTCNIRFNEGFEFHVEFDIRPPPIAEEEVIAFIKERCPVVEKTEYEHRPQPATREDSPSSPFSDVDFEEL